MKLARLLTLLLVFAGTLVAQSAPAAPVPRQRVALALSGGGPVALSQLGVLRYFEEHHIPVDAVAGSSMGGLIGGLYATGHSPDEIQRIMQRGDWDDMLRMQAAWQDLPAAERNLQAQSAGSLTLRLGPGLALSAGVSTAAAADLILSRQVLAYSNVEDFAQLPTPFRCVATRLQSGQAEVLSHGSLARALRATMCVPGLFTPVEWEGHALVDGGLVNNLPVDVARKMNVDVVIGVHLDLPAPPEANLRKLSGVLTQAVSVAVNVTERENLAQADLILAPALEGIAGIDAAHAADLSARGYQAAEHKARFLQTLALNDADWAAYQAERQRRLRPAVGARARVQVLAPAPLAARLQRELGSGEVSLDDLDRRLAAMAAAQSLPGVFYRLAPESAAAPQATIQAAPEPRHESQAYIRPALQFATANGEPAHGALNVFATLLPARSAAQLRLAAALGYSPSLGAEYESPLGATRWFVQPAISLGRDNSATWSGTQHFTHWQDRYAAALDVGYATPHRFRLRAGLQAGYAQLSAVQFSGAPATRDGLFLVPRFIAEWNSLDQPALATRGVLFSAEMRAVYRHAGERATPLGQLTVEAHTPLAAGVVSLALRSASSFGQRPGYFELFPLGGTNDLRGFRFQQFHATDFALGEVSWRRAVTSARIFGERPQLALWYDAAGLRQPAITWQSAQSGSLGVQLNSPLGVITFAVGRTSDGHTRGSIAIGKP